AGLVPSVGSEEFSTTIPKGSVITATPGSDPIGPGGTVTLVVSKGPDLVPVPDVAGKSMRNAIDALQEAGFQVSYNTNYFPNDVILRIATATSTNPAAGTQVPRNSPVYVSGSIGG
ncbi:MAG TPA: PASTA domain-containing protein, partial [Microbacteriaceae bacterium]|nr:PASTA domain-containing protein [Microbacteriaceae bacterium]